MPEQRWFCGGPAGLRPGELIDVTPNFVFVSLDFSTALAHAIYGDGSVYEVEPLDPPWLARVTLAQSWDDKWALDNTEHFCKSVRILALSVATDTSAHRTIFFDILWKLDEIERQEIEQEKRFYHGGDPGLAAGDLLLSPDARGTKSHTQWRAAQVFEAVIGGLECDDGTTLVRYKSDAVWFTSSLARARLYASPGGTLYQVEPLGEAPKSNPRDPEEYFCESARVLRVLEPDVPFLALEFLRKFGWRVRPEIRDFLEKVAPHGLFNSLLRYVDPRLGIHGIEHCRSVFKNGLSIAAATPDAEPLVVAAFAALHDACRLQDGTDPEHGACAAKHARHLRVLGVLPLLPGELNMLCVALEEHDRGAVTEHPTIGTCWDADRLDLPRVGIEVDPSFLSTPFALALNHQRRQTVSRANPESVTHE